MSSIKLKHASGNSMSLAAPATNPASDLELKLPATIGTANQFLRNSGTAGTLEFSSDLTPGIFGSANASKTQDGVIIQRNSSTGNAEIVAGRSGGNYSAIETYVAGASGVTKRYDNLYSGEHRWYAADGTTELMRSKTDGSQLNIGTTVDALGVDTGNNTGINLLGSGRIYVKSNDHSEWNIIDGGAAIRWRYGNTSGSTQTQVGQVTINSSSTTYSTSSDYRLKDNVVAISDGITRLKTLKPYRFNFKVDPDTTVDGFFAHEVTPVVPEAIVGTKDEVDSDDNPVYQGIDQSKLVPLLTAALQEAITEIETLKTKVAALEAA